MAPGGLGSRGSASVCTGPPVRAYRKAPKLCATNRRAPTARPAARRWSVPSVRSRLVITAIGERSGCRASRTLSFPDSTVSSCTITSGSADATACATASGSSASATTGRAPRLRTRSCFDALLVIPTTSWPRATSCGTSTLPRTPVAPATKTFMTDPFVSLFLVRRDSGVACDSAQSAHVVRSALVRATIMTPTRPPSRRRVYADGIPSSSTTTSPAGHRGLPASASMSAQLTLGGDDQQERSCRRLLPERDQAHGHGDVRGAVQRPGPARAVHGGDAGDLDGQVPRASPEVRLLPVRDRLRRGRCDGPAVHFPRPAPSPPSVHDLRPAGGGPDRRAGGRGRGSRRPRCRRLRPLLRRSDALAARSVALA